MNQSVVIYGAGTRGRNWLSVYDLGGGAKEKIIGFCDSNPEKVGTFYCEHAVYGLDELKNMPNIMVLIAVDNKEERLKIRGLLESVGIAKKIFGKISLRY